MCGHILLWKCWQETIIRLTVLGYIAGGIEYYVIPIAECLWTGKIKDLGSVKLPHQIIFPCHSLKIILIFAQAKVTSVLDIAKGYYQVPTSFFKRGNYQTGGSWINSKTNQMSTIS